jgi:hypothetical protein
MLGIGACQAENHHSSGKPPGGIHDAIQEFCSFPVSQRPFWIYKLCCDLGFMGGSLSMNKIRCFLLYSGLWFVPLMQGMSFVRYKNKNRNRVADLQVGFLKRKLLACNCGFPHLTHLRISGCLRREQAPYLPSFLRLLLKDPVLLVNPTLTNARGGTSLALCLPSVV